jgi:hypothetical protein
MNNYNNMSHHGQSIEITVPARIRIHALIVSSTVRRIFVEDPDHDAGKC